MVLSSDLSNGPILKFRDLDLHITPFRHSPDLAYFGRVLHGRGLNVHQVFGRL